MTVQNAPPPGARPIPVMALASEAFALVRDNGTAWFVALLLPLVIELALQYAMVATYGQDPMMQVQQSLLQGKPFDVVAFMRGVGIDLAILIAYVLFAISWHRFALLGQRPTVVPSVQARHVRFVLVSIGVSILIALVSAIAGLVVLSLQQQSMIVLVLTLVITVLLLIRVQLVFPAIALDQRMSLMESWRATRGNSLRLFWLFVLVSLPPIILTMLAGMAFLRPMAGFALTRELDLMSALGFVVTGILGYLLIGLIVGAISSVYRFLILQQQPATS